MSAVNHLELALERNEAFLDQVARMVEHVAPQNEAEFDKLFGEALDLVHSDAVHNAEHLPPRAKRARLNFLWRDWLKTRRS